MGHSVEESLTLLKETRPRVARALMTAQERRTQRLASYLGGARLQGLEQHHEYLDAAEKAYSDSPKLVKLAFLVRRVRADYETALEATLSGYQGVAADAMRDVMEIEALLRISSRRNCSCRSTVSLVGLVAGS